MAALLAQGEKSKHKYKCSMETETCLTMMAERFMNMAWDGMSVAGIGMGKPLLIEAVAEGSPAETAGIKVGDYLVKMGDFETRDLTYSELIEVMKSFKVGQEVPVTILRGEKEMVVPVVMAQLPYKVQAQWIGSHFLKQHLDANRKP